MSHVNATRSNRHPQTGEPAQPLGTPLTVRGRLALLGWTSIDTWAKAHGYERKTASYCIRTWGNRTDRRPHGGISRALMADLHATLAKGLRPEHIPTKEKNHAS